MVVASVSLGLLGPVASIVCTSGLEPTVFTAIRAAIGATILGAVAGSISAAFPKVLVIRSVRAIGGSRASLIALIEPVPGLSSRRWCWAR